MIVPNLDIELQGGVWMLTLAVANDDHADHAGHDHADEYDDEHNDAGQDDHDGPRLVPDGDVDLYED